MIHDPYDAWDPPEAEVVAAGGPSRIYDDQPTEEPPRPRVGFTPTLPEREPLLWDADQA